MLDGKIKRKIKVPLDQPQAPALLPDGRHAVFAGLREGVADIWKLDMETGTVENLTRDDFYDNNPQVSPDGKLIVYERNVSGNRKIYAFPLDDPSRKTQLTFGPFDDTAPYFSTEGNTIYYSSDEDNDIFNLRGLDLQTGAIQQYTEVFGAHGPGPGLRARGRPPRLHHVLQGRVQAPHTGHGRSDEGDRPGGARRFRGDRGLPARHFP